MLVQFAFMMLGITDQYYYIEPLIGLTEWKEYIQYYSTLYKVVEGLTVWDNNTRYFTKNENNEYILVDQTEVNGKVDGILYYLFAP